VVPLTCAAVIAAVALPLPLIVRLARLPMPEIVLQIVLGITTGPPVLDWAHGDASVRVPSLLGWAFPLLQEIDREDPGGLGAQELPPGRA
jgi:hypothetical protein